MECFNAKLTIYLIKIYLILKLLNSIILKNFTIKKQPKIIIKTNKIMAKEVLWKMMIKLD